MAVMWAVVLSIMPRVFAVAASMLVPPVSGTEANAACLQVLEDKKLARLAQISKQLQRDETNDLSAYAAVSSTDQLKREAKLRFRRR